MLPGLRLVTAAIAVSILLVMLGVGGMSKLRVAQSQSASLPSPEARFAGLAFAERADWTPDTTSPQTTTSQNTSPPKMSLESLPPFSQELGTQAPSVSPPPAAAMTNADVRQPAPTEAKIADRTAPAKAESPAPLIVAAIDPAPVDLTPGPTPPEPAKPESNSVGPIKQAEAPAMPAPVPAIEVRVVPAAMADAPVSSANPDPAPVIVASIEPETALQAIEDTPAPPIPAAEVVLPMPRPAKVKAVIRKPAPAKAKASSHRAKAKNVARSARRPPSAAPAPAVSTAPSNPLAQLFGGSRPAPAPRN